MKFDIKRARRKWFMTKVKYAAVYFSSSAYVAAIPSSNLIKTMREREFLDIESAAMLDSLVEASKDGAELFFNLLSLYRNKSYRQKYQFVFTFVDGVDVIREIVNKDFEESKKLHGVNEEIASHEDFMLGYQKGYDDALADIRTGKIQL